MSADGVSERRRFAFDPANAAAFGELDVARCYAFRPSYAPALYSRLLELAPRRDRALDLGCGPGTIALALAPLFDRVIAVDPSRPMLDAGRERGGRLNISWLRSRAEDVVVEGPFDLIAIGTAVHWMQHDIVFPRLASWLSHDGVLAIIGNERGEEPEHSTRNARWIDFLSHWLDRVGRKNDPQGFFQAGRTYMPWMNVLGVENFDFDFWQPLEEFIVLQHSTATFARVKMGQQLADEFDHDLRRTLSPFEQNGLLHFRVRSGLVWGTPKTEKEDST